MNEPKATQPPGADAAVDPSIYRLRLYVSGATPRSTRAIANIKAIGERRLHGRYELEVIDAYQQAEMARDQQIIVLPTLIKSLPGPLRRMVGDLSEEQVLQGLGLGPRRAQMTTNDARGATHDRPRRGGSGAANDRTNSHPAEDAPATRHGTGNRIALPPYPAAGALDHDTSVLAFSAFMMECAASAFRHEQQMQATTRATSLAQMRPRHLAILTRPRNS
jgi:circadian clock protein KaiB